MPQGVKNGLSYRVLLCPPTFNKANCLFQMCLLTLMSIAHAKQINLFYLPLCYAMMQCLKHKYINKMENSNIIFYQLKVSSRIRKHGRKRNRQPQQNEYRTSTCHGCLNTFTLTVTFKAMFSSSGTNLNRATILIVLNIREIIFEN